MPVVDVHTHMLNDDWLRRIREHGGPHYTVGDFRDQEVIFMDGAPFMTLTEGMFDYGLRIKNMDAAGVDIAIVSLTCPSVYWGGAEISLDVARMMNDDMAAQQRARPDRIRWFASLPWQYPDLAIQELTRACGNGAVGVFVTANVRGMSLTDKSLAPVWDAIDKQGLPVLVHPSAPPGVGEMDMGKYNLVASVGFVFDTSLAV
ncbi:MAG: amidohydrolase family protein, partial [Rhodospirillales bacterium]|nr:amidohydrolase family protein [Rhodospirillales bacterium]